MNGSAALRGDAPVFFCLQVLRHGDVEVKRKMATRGVDGRFAKKGARTAWTSEALVKKSSPARAAAAGRGMTRDQAMAEARRQFAEALPEIAAMLLVGAKDGSISHLKLLVELGGLEKGSLGPTVKKRKSKSLEEVLIAEWRKQPEASGDDSDQ